MSLTSLYDSFTSHVNEPYAHSHGAIRLFTHVERIHMAYGSFTWDVNESYREWETWHIHCMANSHMAHSHPMWMSHIGNEPGAMRIPHMAYGSFTWDWNESYREVREMSHVPHSYDIWERWLFDLMDEIHRGDVMRFISHTYRRHDIWLIHMVCDVFLILNEGESCHIHRDMTFGSFTWDVRDSFTWDMCLIHMGHLAHSHGVWEICHWMRERYATFISFIWHMGKMTI